MLSEWLNWVGGHLSNPIAETNAVELAIAAMALVVAVPALQAQLRSSFKRDELTEAAKYYLDKNVGFLSIWLYVLIPTSCLSVIVAALANVIVVFQAIGCIIAFVLINVVFIVMSVLFCYPVVMWRYDMWAIRALSKDD